MSATIEQLHNDLIGYLKEGKFAEGIEDFYAEDVTAQENSEPVSQGRAEMAANERRFLKKVTDFHGIDVHATSITDHGHGNGHVFYEATMKWNQSDRPDPVQVHQTVVERWKDGKVQAIRFYGNFNPGTLPE